MILLFVYIKFAENLESGMKISLLVVGKTTESYFVRGIEEYSKRLAHYVPFETIVIPELRNTKSLSTDQQKEREADLILKALLPGDYIVLLDERGKEFSSMQFASYLEKKMANVAKRLLFVVGGPYGFSDRIYDIAQEKISLSKMTYSHQMIRLIFVEQCCTNVSLSAVSPFFHASSPHRPANTAAKWVPCGALPYRNR